MWVFLVPAAALAQDATITGFVRDSSGAVLPGVTVEASSPALIEKSRVVTTDGSGQYRIVSLRPGVYTVTFTLAGFSVVRREGIELTGSFTATVNADMRVGGLEETVTVSGQAPLVDVQSVKQQRVLSDEVVAAIPSGRTIQTLAVLVPGVSNASPYGHDVGGTALLGQQQYVAHGSDFNEYRVQVDGFILGNAYQSFTGFIPNLGSSQEVTIQMGSAQADQWSGGVLMNVVPKDGGNTHAGSFFINGATSGLQSDNFTQRVKDRNLQTPNTVKRLFDINPAFGGPIVRDKLWFYGSARWLDTQSYAGNAFFNKNAGLRDVWTYEPDFTRKGFNHNYSYGGGGRGTWQINRKNKLSIAYEYQESCTCQEVGFNQPNFANALNATPEAAAYSAYPHSWMLPITWSSPVTNRLLLEAGFLGRSERNSSSGPAPRPGDPRLDLIPVLDFGTGIAYHGTVPTVTAMYSDFVAQVPQMRAAMSYVSGAHALKVGLNYLYNHAEVQNTDNNSALRYIFFNGFPISVLEVAAPFTTHQRGSELGLYAQDRWTVKRLTLNLGLRFDQYKTWFPDHQFGPGTLVPTRNFTIPAQDFYNLKDLSPRLGVVYDVFGKGKTAVRASANRYPAGFSVAYWNGNPASPLSGLVPNTVLNLASRSWFDANQNYVPDCNLPLAAANGECGAMPATFGQPVINTIIDPRTLTGWGHRGYNWEFSIGAQHELFPRVSVDVAYIRRMYGNFLVTDNRALAPSDYDRFSVTAPRDPRLPNGGGYVIGDLYDLNPARTVGGIPQDNFQTFSDDYGKQRLHWNGVDVNVTARPGRLLVAGGFSTGRALGDNCDVVTKLDNPSAVNYVFAPTGSIQSTSYCNRSALFQDYQGTRPSDKFLTQIKGYAAYTIPRIDVQVAGTFQSLPGPEITAFRVYTNAEIAPSLGRSLSAGAQTVSVNLVQPGTLYGERLNQIDFRVGKVLRFGRTRTAVNVDFYNAFNRDTILAQSNNYATWQDAQTNLQGRIAKVSAQFEF
jgi:hypothetical protein